MDKGATMLKYGTNLSMMFTEYPFAERVRRTAELGFKSFEFLFPRQIDVDECFALKEEYGLTVHLFDPNVPADGPFKRGYLCLPGQEAEDGFRRSFDEALKVADKLGTKLFNTLVGLRVPEVSREKQTEIAIKRLQKVAPAAAAQGVTVMVEAINLYGMPGYFLNHSADGFAIVDAVGAPNVKFQYDIYHLQIMEGNLITTMTNNLDKIAHIQVADVPGRHQPGTGEINFPNVLKALEDAGYQGYIGLEYVPEGSSEQSLSWLKDLK
ncbi:MAG: TIM barrel protein [Chloroflexi bacterium]|nr:TIM barrel protein [Chloroflexota bacterium]